ncbi:MAG: 4Fe-4S binding protein [Ferrimicrobium sp.]|jgi:2-oxoglutarate ferredoxin oxidoreductase subunit delta|uniref:4Fe-4S binding protein n=1 Tax=Ferrimicrobium acidiphilum TaxID=121039 RepID=A0ABV3Y614_9ACTN|nr:4Fe-4S binding protein [Ferrimicrobium sp.]MDA8400499.1 4Fe-4S binding protein [Actinomycetota bacterium]
MTSLDIKDGATTTGGLNRADIVHYRQGQATLTVRRTYCKGCNLCVDACPASILALDDDDKIYVTDMSRCIFCGVCAGRCPDFVFVLNTRTQYDEGGSQ